MPFEKVNEVLDFIESTLAKMLKPIPHPPYNYIDELNKPKTNK